MASEYSSLPSPPSIYNDCLPSFLTDPVLYVSGTDNSFIYQESGGQIDNRGTENLLLYAPVVASDGMSILQPILLHVAPASRSNESEQKRYYSTSTNQPAEPPPQVALVIEKPRENVPVASEKTKHLSSTTSISSLSSIISSLHNSSNITVPKNSGHGHGCSTFISKDAIDDGYHWHKYGQKLLRGAVYPTCYYRCAHLGCSARRQVSRDPQTHEIISAYVGEHSHPKPQLVSTEVWTQEELERVVSRGSLFIWRDSYNNLHICDGYGDVPLSDANAQVARPRKNMNIEGMKEDGADGKNITDLGVGVINMEPFQTTKHVIETGFSQLSANVDGTRELAVRLGDDVKPQNDGFFWTKYGQKRPTPGSPSSSVHKLYFRCSVEGCGVKKLVQVATQTVPVNENTIGARHPSDAPSVGTLVIYKGTHNHAPNSTKMAPR